MTIFVVVSAVTATTSGRCEGTSSTKTRRGWTEMMMMMMMMMMSVVESVVKSMGSRRGRQSPPRRCECCGCGSSRIIRQKAGGLRATKATDVVVVVVAVMVIMMLLNQCMGKILQTPR